MITVKATKQHLREAKEDAKLLYLLHNNNYIMKGITVEQIKKKTQEDKTLQKLLNHARSGKKPITPELQ